MVVVAGEGYDDAGVHPRRKVAAAIIARPLIGVSGARLTTPHLPHQGLAAGEKGRDGRGRRGLGREGVDVRPGLDPGGDGVVQLLLGEGRRIQALAEAQVQQARSTRRRVVVWLQARAVVFVFVLLASLLLLKLLPPRLLLLVLLSPVLSVSTRRLARGTVRRRLARHGPMQRKLSRPAPEAPMPTVEMRLAKVKLGSVGDGRCACYGLASE